MTKRGHVNNPARSAAVWSADARVSQYRGRKAFFHVDAAAPARDGFTIDEIRESIDPFFDRPCSQFSVKPISPNAAGKVSARVVSDEVARSLGLPHLLIDRPITSAEDREWALTAQKTWGLTKPDQLRPTTIEVTRLDGSMVRYHTVAYPHESPEERLRRVLAGFDGLGIS